MTPLKETPRGARSDANNVENDRCGHCTNRVT